MELVKLVLEVKDGDEDIDSSVADHLPLLALIATPELGKEIKKERDGLITSSSTSSLD
jgi:hypothetical protein